MITPCRSGTEMYSDADGAEIRMSGRLFHTVGQARRLEGPAADSRQFDRRHQQTIGPRFLFVFVLTRLGSRVVSVLDSGAEGPGFKSQSRRCRITVLGKLIAPRTHCASVHQAGKLVAALLRVAGVTAGLAESNGSLPPGL